jgi:hypothetical protein
MGKITDGDYLRAERRLNRRFTMAKLAVVLLLAFAALTAGLSASAFAAKRSVKLYATTVQLHFTSPSGKSRTITEKVYIDAGHSCDGYSDPLIYNSHPELKGMTLSSVTCKDSAGAARPGGPAIVVLLFIVDGQVKKTALDHEGSKTFDMKSCALDLPRMQDALVAEVKGQFPHGRFVGAHCMARPKYLSTFLNSNN